MGQKERGEREDKYACWLCNFPYIGNRQIQRLLQMCGSAEAVYRAGKEVWGEVLKPKRAELLCDYTGNWDVETKYREMLEEGIQLVTILDDNYPARLKNIPDAPFGLFVRGKLPGEDMPAIAVIGARECSEYGRYVAGELGRALGRLGAVVVSGMAKGIDGISQEAALEAGGISIGVLGSGVDICYPAQNKGLYGRLLKGGAVLSSYPNGTPACPQNFPPRNRIVSGLADAVVVIEARAKSGTLITVDMALEQGREVYVVPGRVTDRLSDGCNRLIKQGAGMVLNPESFWEEILQIRENKKEQKNKKIITKKHFSDKPGNSGTYGTTSSWDEGICGKQTDKLPGELGEVYDVLDFYPRTVEEIAMALPEERRNMQIVPYLMQLCMEEKAIQVSPGHFCRKGTDKFPFPC